MSESLPTPIPKPAITAAGTAVLWIGSGLVFLGCARFSGVTILLGVLCWATMITARWLCQKNLSDVELRRRLPRSAFAGELFETLISIYRVPEGRFQIDGFDLEFRDSLLSLAAAEEIGHLQKDTVITFPIRARLPRRGLHSRARFELKSSWPFGLFSMRIVENYQLPNAMERDEILIFPRPLMPALLLRQLENFQAESLAKNSFEQENAGDFRGIRPYRPGDPVKSIHWPATARARELVVRDWDPPQPKPQRFGVILHSLATPGQMLTPDRFETAVRIATGLLIYCRENGIPVWISPDLKSIDWLKIPDQTGFTAALEALALIRPLALKSPKKLQKRIQHFERCERLFVISDSAIASWRSSVSGRHPSLILSDPDSVSTGKGRRVRVSPKTTANHR